LEHGRPEGRGVNGVKHKVDGNFLKGGGVEEFKGRGKTKD
jgi:hypothetical protein